MMLDFAIVSKVGGREINEDSISVAENNDRYGFIVCGGLGGHGMGDCFLNPKTAKEWLSKMVEIVEKNHNINNADNYSAIVVVNN